MRLTDITVRNLTAPEQGQTTYPDDVVTGFGIRVSQGGSKTFTLVFGRERRRVTIGRVGVVSLADARQEARRILAEHTLGRSRPQALTYKQAVEQFLAEKAKGRRPRTVKDYRRLLFKLNFTGQLAEITHDDLERKLSRAKAPGEYNHQLTAFKVFANWCMKRRHITDNPTIGISANKTVSRSRVLTDDELRRVWIAAEQCGQFGVIVRLLILTGLRRSECASLRSNFIKEDQCQIPESLTKNGRQHTFILGPVSQTLLRQQQSALEPTMKSSGSFHLFPARGKAHCFNGWSKSKKRLDDLSGVHDWVLHDLRRTFATIHARIGTSPHIIERMLNHTGGVISGVAAIYNRHSFLPEMRAAAASYENYVNKIVT